MGKPKKSNNNAGKNTQSPGIKIAVKLLFQNLQCVHHLANIGNPSQEGIKAKAFRKKQKELDNFVRPAQEGLNSEFRRHFQELTFRYLSYTLESLRVHYLARMQTLCIEIQQLGLTNSDLQTASQIAIKWGRKNFRSKLRTDSIAEFERTVQSCIQTPKHDITLNKKSSPQPRSSNSPAQGEGSPLPTSASASSVPSSSKPIFPPGFSTSPSCDLSFVYSSISSSLPAPPAPPTPTSQSTCPPPPPSAAMPPTSILPATTSSTSTLPGTTPSTSTLSATSPPVTAPPSTAPLAASQPLTASAPATSLPLAISPSAASQHPLPASAPLPAAPTAASPIAAATAPALAAASTSPTSVGPAATATLNAPPAAPPAAACTTPTATALPPATATAAVTPPSAAPATTIAPPSPPATTTAPPAPAAPTSSAAAPPPAPAAPTTSAAAPPPPHSNPSSSQPFYLSSPRYKGLYDLGAEPLNVQGPRCSLSNFYPCKFVLDRHAYRDTESAYQDSKALFLLQYDKSIEIKSAPYASKAKEWSKPLKKDPRYPQWCKKKANVMLDIFRKKAKQVPIFREDLLVSYPRRITHNLPDEEWGSTFMWKGELFKGRDLFASLLMQVRLELLVESGYFGSPPSSTIPPPPQAPGAQPSTSSPPASPSPSPSTSKSTVPSPSTTAPSTPTTLPTSNRFSPLQVNDLDFPKLPKPATPLCTPPPRQTRSKGPNLYYHGQDKNTWETPSCSSKVVFIGDSNLNKITKKPTKPVDSIEIHSFPGAKTRHFFKNICTSKSKPQKSPDHVVISVGFNDKGNTTSTHMDQMKKAISMVSKTFPNAQVYIPLINYSSSLLEPNRASLDSLNQVIQELAGNSKNVQTIPKIDPSLFSTDELGIHWSNKTANALQEHWLSHLN